MTPSRAARQLEWQILHRGIRVPRTHRGRRLGGPVRRRGFRHRQRLDPCSPGGAVRTVGSLPNVTSFGETATKEIVAVTYDGSLWRLRATA